MQVYKTIKYIRLSYTDDKSVESDSVANQRRLIDDYIARHPEIEVVAEKIDDGYSGVLFDRPAFQEMMRMIEQGEANCVIVKDLSRLGREYIETGRYMRRVFPAYGVRFIAINDDVDSAKGENDFAVFKNVFNDYYAKDTSKKVRAIKKMQAERGERLGGKPPYGYKKKDKDSKEIIPDEETAPIVRRIFDLCAAGKGAEPDRQNPDPRAGAESDQPVLSDYRSCLYQSGYHPSLHLVRQNRG